jgi:hypothetical protein
MTGTEAELPNLDELRGELEAVGMVVVPFRNEIHIRRSTLEYIKVRVDGGVLRCEPRIGFLSMSRSTWLLLGIEFVEMFAVMHPRAGVPTGGLFAVFVGLLAFGVHALRYTLADITISRVQAIWLELRSRHRVSGGQPPSSLSASTVHALPEATSPGRHESGSHRDRTRAEADVPRSKTPV